MARRNGKTTGATARVVPLAALLLLFVAVTAPTCAWASSRGLSQFSAASARASASASASSFNFGFGLGPGFNWGGSQANAAASASARAASFYQSSVQPWSSADAEAAAKSVATQFGPRFGLDQSGANCLADAVASSMANGPGSKAAAEAGANSLAVGGDGLGSLAKCGAQAKSIASSLSCRRYIAPSDGNLCDFAGNFDTSCHGLQLVNPNVGYVKAGETFNVPPCSA